MIPENDFPGDQRQAPHKHRTANVVFSEKGKTAVAFPREGENVLGKCKMRMSATTMCGRSRQFPFCPDQFCCSDLCVRTKCAGVGKGEVPKVCVNSEREFVTDDDDDDRR